MSVSTVIDEHQIRDLPYSGRDVYTLLVIQPGVSSDNATGKGLGLSVNGQRVAGTNFLLDGVDNNDPLLTGPAVNVPAEAVEEYRMTTNNFSAEQGRATAFIADVVTRTGGNQFHGSAWEYFDHDRLNANTFANNYQGIVRAPFRFNQTGGLLGGPIRKEKLFFLASFERLYSDSQSPSQLFYVPSSGYTASLPSGSLARQLLNQFRPPAGQPDPADPNRTGISAAEPLLQRNTQVLGRVDFHPPLAATRLGFRYALSQNVSDDFLWSIYPDFRAPLTVRDQNLEFNATFSPEKGGVNEFRAGLTLSSNGFQRPHPETPVLVSFFEPVTLPGSAAYYDYQYGDHTWHVLDNYSLQLRNHRLAVGFDARRLSDDSTITPYAAGIYSFDNLASLAASQPAELQITVDRLTGHPLQQADYGRRYTQNEGAAFVQDDWNVSSRLVVNLGLRWEYFGVPHRADGPPDWNLFYGPGTDFISRLASAQFQQAEPYAPDHHNFAPRFGFAWRARGGDGAQGSLVVRGGYGIAYDRIFDKVWQDLRNNSLAVADLFAGQPGLDFAFPARNSLPAVSPTFGEEIPVMVDQTLRTPYAQNWFLGAQYHVGKSLLFELNHAGSLGRKLIDTDDINRPFGKILPGLNDISYRGNQGASDYVSLQASARKSFEHNLAFQVSYTFSRARDNQSDPFRNPLINYSLPATSRLSDPGLLQINTAEFTQQFNSSLDRGLSDFDQTHNLVWNLIAQSPEGAPWWARQWQLASLAGIRSGFPFTVFDSSAYTSSFGLLYANRPNLAGPVGGAELASPQPAPGGLVLLDRTKFSDPAPGQIGNLSRNAFRGPKFWNLDLSLSRSFPVPAAGERGSVQFRADFFNIFNHTNLSTPASDIAAPGFGYASYGRTGFSGSLPSVTPLSEQPRRIQLALKLSF